MRAALLSVLFVAACVASSRATHAMPTIKTRPYKQDAAGATERLSTDLAAPTVFTWGEYETIRWWATSTSAENGIPESSWHVRPLAGGDVGDYPSALCVNGKTRFCGTPQNELQADDFEFWVVATDDEGTDTSETFYIRMTFPPIVETDYFPAAPEFRGKLARAERTAFDFGAIPHGIADSPEVNGCDNPSMFYGDGKLHFIFGDPNVYSEDPTDANRGLHGAMAFTDEIVPEKGIDISHERNWVMDPQTDTAKSIIDRLAGTSRANNTSGAIVPRGDGHRIWFAVYDYGSGPRPSYRNYYQMSIAYSDDGFATPAVRDANLILWDKDDPGNGPNNPDPYLGYHMRVFKDHLYMMIPREGGSDPVLLRCRLDELDNRSLDNWHYLLSVDEAGVASWSEQGVTRGQISQADFPTVDFSGDPASIVTSSTWNPYLNRWIAFPALGTRVWQARQLWGPYEDLSQPQFFTFTQFAQYYALFGHELLLGNNGEWIYHAQARSWQPLGYYGTYNQRLRLRDKLKMTVSPKTGVQGDTLTITCTNDTGLPAPPPGNVSVTVDGNPATFVGQSGDTFEFSYELTGGENGGAVGLIDVSGVMDVPFTAESAYRCSRDVAFVANHRNELSAAITSPAPGAAVSGWVPIDVSAAYESGPELLAPQQPDVKILKTELRHVGAEEEVLDTDVDPPYTLHADTTRFADGQQTFKVIAYDTLDRRGVAEITLGVANGPQPTVGGNLVADGNMEAADPAAWQPLSGATLSKVADRTHRSGERSLLIHSASPGSYAGFRQTVTGLEGGERLRLTAWSRLKSNYTAQVRWIVRDRSGVELFSQYAPSFGYFRRVNHEFDNPAGNTELMLDCLIRDTGGEGVVAGTGVTSVEAVIDDVVLRPACHPLVERPRNIQAEPDPTGGSITVSWAPATDVNVEFYGIYRRQLGAQPAAWEQIGEVRAHESGYTDDAPAGPFEQLEYDVVSIDEMGSTSADVEPLGEISDVLSGAPPLLLVGTDDNSLVVERHPGASAYNVYADALGSWYSPSLAEGSVCGVTAWTDNGDGTVTLQYEVPESSWIVVTASNQCEEGPAGRASDGSSRTASGTWPTCGPHP
jgi:hypothetical protein